MPLWQVTPGCSKSFSDIFRERERKRMQALVDHHEGLAQDARKKLKLLESSSSDNNNFKE